MSRRRDRADLVDRDNHLHRPDGARRSARLHAGARGRPGRGGHRRRLRRLLDHRRRRPRRRLCGVGRGDGCVPPPPGAWVSSRSRRREGAAVCASLGASSRSSSSSAQSGGDASSAARAWRPWTCGVALSAGTATGCLLYWLARFVPGLRHAPDAASAIAPASSGGHERVSGELPTLTGAQLRSDEAADAVPQSARCASWLVRRLALLLCMPRSLFSRAVSAAGPFVPCERDRGPVRDAHRAICRQSALQQLLRSGLIPDGLHAAVEQPSPGRPSIAPASSIGALDESAVSASGEQAQGVAATTDAGLSGEAPGSSKRQGAHTAGLCLLALADAQLRDGAVRAQRFSMLAACDDRLRPHSVLLQGGEMQRRRSSTWRGASRLEQQSETTRSARKVWTGPSLLSQPRWCFSLTGGTTVLSPRSATKPRLSRGVCGKGQTREGFLAEVVRVLCRLATRVCWGTFLSAANDTKIELQSARASPCASWLLSRRSCKAARYRPRRPPPQCTTSRRLHLSSQPSPSALRGRLPRTLRPVPARSNLETPARPLLRAHLTRRYRTTCLH